MTRSSQAEPEAVPANGANGGTWLPQELRKLAHPVKVGDSNALKGEDITYVKQARHLVRRHLVGGSSRWLPWLCLTLVGLLVWWASWAELEEVTRGMGKVIPSKSVQVIQSLEGGIIEEIYVQEGELVEKDQPLLRLRDAIFASSYNENLAKKQVFEARIARLQAEVNNFAELSFPAGIRPDLERVERDLFEKRRLDYITTKESLAARLKLAQAEEKLLRDGTKSRAVSPVELLRSQKDVEQIAGEARMLETKAQREAMEHLHQDNAELHALTQALVRDKDRLDRTVIRSPARGTVNKIYINTVGRVIGSAVDIMEVVPADDSLLVQANVRPADIAFIHPGQSAKVKFTAYDFAIYGGLEGKLEHISVDTISGEKSEHAAEKREESFYQIKVRTSRNTLGRDRNGKELEIIPGMVAEVDILTGKKTVLTYLLKPINRARMRAFTER